MHNYECPRTIIENKGVLKFSSSKFISIFYSNRDNRSIRKFYLKISCYWYSTSKRLIRRYLSIKHTLCFIRSSYNFVIKTIMTCYMKLKFGV